jgi:hypothetical protein
MKIEYKIPFYTLVVYGSPMHKIDDALEFILGTDRNVDGSRWYS